MRYFLVDVEAWGPSPVSGQMTEFGVVEFESRAWFHGVIYDAKPSEDNPACPDPTTAKYDPHYGLVDYAGIAYESGPLLEKDVFKGLSRWLEQWDGPYRMVSDNPAYDYMWLAAGFDSNDRENPFGHTARRIGDLYAGFAGKWKDTTSWKRWRQTPHTHNPVDDAMCNAEALQAILDRYTTCEGSC